MGKRVFIATEDTYARDALRILVQELLGVSSRVKIDVYPLRPCSSKMTRILRAALLDDDVVAVVVLVDSETRNPDEVVNEITLKHLGGVHEKACVIALRPCIEEWPCTILGLKNCNTPPCSMGPAKSINEYWIRNHGRKYSKNMLPDVFKEMLIHMKQRSAKEPNTLKQFIQAISSATKTLY